MSLEIKVEATPQAQPQTGEAKPTRLLQLAAEGNVDGILVETLKALEENAILRKRIRGQRSELRRFNREANERLRTEAHFNYYMRYQRLRGQLIEAFGLNAVINAEHPKIIPHPSNPDVKQQLQEEPKVVWWDPRTWRHDA